MLSILLLEAYKNAMLINEANMGIDWGNMDIDRTCEQLWEISTFSFEHTLS